MPSDAERWLFLSDHLLKSRIQNAYRGDTDHFAFWHEMPDGAQVIKDVQRNREEETAALRLAANRLKSSPQAGDLSSGCAFPGSFVGDPLE